MGNDHTDDKAPREVTETAADWLDRLASDSVAAADRRAFARWLLKSPVHVSEFLQLSALRAELTGSLQRHPEWVDELLQTNPGNVIDLTDQSAPAVPVPNTVPRQPRRRFAAAAVIAILAIAGWLGYASLTDTPADPPAIATALGEQRSILLSDGSTLELNTETEVRIRMSDAAREVDLLRGELLVDVVKDPARPFRVLSDGVVAQAIGTRFNVYKRGSDTVVTVIEGRVAVNQTPPSPDGTQAAGTVGTNEPIELTAGLQVAVANQPAAATPVDLTPEPVNLDKATAWTERRLVFDDEPLSAIVTEFNRYNRSRLIIADDALSEKRLSGVFDANDPDEFIALLSNLERIDIQQSTEGHRTLLRVESTNGERQDDF